MLENIGEWYQKDPKGDLKWMEMDINGWWATLCPCRGAFLVSSHPTISVSCIAKLHIHSPQGGLDGHVLDRNLPAFSNCGTCFSPGRSFFLGSAWCLGHRWAPSSHQSENVLQWCPCMCCNEASHNFPMGSQMTRLWETHPSGPSSHGNCGQGTSLHENRFSIVRQLLGKSIPFSSSPVSHCVGPSPAQLLVYLLQAGAFSALESLVLPCDLDLP